MTIIENPLSLEELLDLKDDSDRIRCVIPVALFSIIETDNYGFLDILSTSLLGRSCLSDSDVEYKIVGQQDPYTLLLEVSANISTFLDEERSFDL